MINSNTSHPMIDWNTIDTVLLDMDGTLLDLHYDNHFWMEHLPKRYSEVFHLPIEAAREKLHAHINRLEGTLNWYCLDYWSKALAIDIVALKRETQKKIKERPYALDFLAALKQAGKTCHLVTNAHPAGLGLKFQRTQISQYLDGFTSSHEFQIPKEDKAFWVQLSESIDFDPDRTLFIDDNADILKTAADFGIRHTLGIHQPDSQKPRQLNGLNAIYHFNEIMDGI